MRIAIPSDDETSIAPHTGRTRGFLIYEIKESRAEKVEYRCNDFTAHAKGECQGDEQHSETHQHHSHAPLLDALQDCQVVIAGGMGPRLVADLKRRGLEVVFCEADNADSAAQAFARRELVSLDNSSCCRHNQ